MANIIFVASGVCGTCGHSQEAHEGNQGCTAPSTDDKNHPCMCTNIGSY
ncbi:MAG: hypothetical protein ACKO7N_00010 [Candidatus Nitrosotenuis sp.]